MRFLLVDGNNCAYRSHSAQNELRTEDGRKSGAIHGFFRSLYWIQRMSSTPSVQTIIVWDGGHAEERKLIHPDYKAGRGPRTPEGENDHQAYVQQLDVIRKLVDYSPLRQIRVRGVEADDIISVVANLLSEDQHTSVVFSGDHDFFPLALNDYIKVFPPKRESWMTREDIERKTECPRLEWLQLFRAICGDKSDNIDGIPQMGKKRAAIACAYLATLNGHDKVEVYNSDWDEKDGKWVQKVLDHQDLIERNLRLMRLPQNWAESFYSPRQAKSALEQFCQPISSDSIRFVKLLNDWEMKTLIDEAYRW